MDYVDPSAACTQRMSRLRGIFVISIIPVTFAYPLHSMQCDVRFAAQGLVSLYGEGRRQLLSGAWNWSDSATAPIRGVEGREAKVLPMTVRVVVETDAWIPRSPRSKRSKSSSSCPT